MRHENKTATANVISSKLIPPPLFACYLRFQTRMPNFLDRKYLYFLLLAQAVHSLEELNWTVRLRVKEEESL